MQQQPQIWLKSPAAIFTANAMDAGNGLVIQGKQIIELVPTGQQPHTDYDQYIDCSDLIITPGLINTHHHFYQTLTRCVPGALNKPLFPWLKFLYQVWKNLDAKMLYSATQLAGLELMLSGSTTVADHHYVFPKGLENAIDIQVEAINSLGCRATLTRGSMSLGESQGGLPPDSVIQTEDRIITDSQRLIDTYHDRTSDAMIQIALAPCSPFSVSKQLMQATAELALKNDVMLHTHLAETEDENNFCLKQYGMRPLDYLESCGWLNDKTWLAHGIHFTPDEIVRLGKARIGIAHCPSSNMLLASGICPTVELEQAGCNIGLAVDGSASNDCSNMIQEVRQSLLQQRLRYGAQTITAERVLGYATTGSAKVLGRQQLGQIQVGYQADLALFSCNELRFSGAGDPIAALVTCGAHQVSKLMVAGKWLIEDSQHGQILQSQLMQTHHALAKSLQAKTL
ncbi:8-oxoguanine deaminase [Paraglaciecola hydrolytica]|uniref:8-oxoguanine deaminase n=1 Tax=Paraglaciecola hydrolytica TaxID=1799789 RepID=A0A148KN60_9ALTE|nr:8-oxoguanine deaminase [Paraglaciecola hydrolytica]KXI27721.1 8-oxoguanine deaminase [Paraglaciecola hydrolytica]